MSDSREHQAALPSLNPICKIFLKTFESELDLGDGLFSRWFFQSPVSANGVLVFLQKKFVLDLRS
jgi:hypothetical protein